MSTKESHNLSPSYAREMKKRVEGKLYSIPAEIVRSVQWYFEMRGQLLERFRAGEFTSEVLEESLAISWNHMLSQIGITNEHMQFLLRRKMISVFSASTMLMALQDSCNSTDGIQFPTQTVPTQPPVQGPNGQPVPPAQFGIDSQERDHEWQDEADQVNELIPIPPGQ